MFFVIERSRAEIKKKNFHYVIIAVVVVACLMTTIVVIIAHIFVTVAVIGYLRPL